MKRDDFNKLLEKMGEEELAISKSKGKEYSGDEDVLDNFKRHAADLGLDPEKILWVYVSKHIDAVRSYVRTGSYFSNESILDRIKDIRVYMSLLAAMAIEKSDEFTATGGSGRTQI